MGWLVHGSLATGSDFFSTGLAGGGGSGLAEGGCTEEGASGISCAGCVWPAADWLSIAGTLVNTDATASTSNRVRLNCLLLPAGMSMPTKHRPFSVRLSDPPGRQFPEP